jgi:ectoine hydroxylase-related dioxygenase (phytanoyl-CoA dioxygenase family)
MKVSYVNIIKYIESKDKDNLLKISNFYNTFGYLILENGIKDEEINLLRNRVFDMANSALLGSGESVSDINKTLIMHKALEGSQECLNWFLLKNNYIKIIRLLLGEHAAFFNSDANIFVHESSWHRDVGTILPTLKFLVYLQDSDRSSGGGDFAVIPGSHWVSDVYSSHLNENGSWPTGTPFSHNYYGYIDNTKRSKLRRKYDGSQFPFHTIKVKKNDIVLFDSRLYHTTYLHPASRFPFFWKKNFIRLNFTSFFIANPQDISSNSWLSKKMETSNIGNELDDFYRLISIFEDCRYHSNLKNIDRYLDFGKNLYYGKYGYTDESVCIFNSAGAQNDLDSHLRKWFIPSESLDVFK